MTDEMLKSLAEHIAAQLKTDAFVLVVADGKSMTTASNCAGGQSALVRMLETALELERKRLARTAS